MVSTEEIDTHAKRIILQNPSLPSITDNTVSSVYAFGRLLGRMADAYGERLPSLRGWIANSCLLQTLLWWQIWPSARLSPRWKIEAEKSRKLRCKYGNCKWNIINFNVAFIWGAVNLERPATARLRLTNQTKLMIH